MTFAALLDLLKAFPSLLKLWPLLFCGALAFGYQRVNRIETVVSWMAENQQIVMEHLGVHPTTPLPLFEEE